MTLSLSTMAPTNLNGTVLATTDLTLSPNVAETMFKHSDNQYASVISVTGATPVVSFSTPLKPAYDLIGLTILKLTAFDHYLAKFTDYAKDATSTHVKYALDVGATAIAAITGINASQGGIAMAQVTVMLLSSTNGMTHPLVRTANNALPNVASEPALHTVGPISINGTRIDGTRSISGTLGQAIQTPAHDGELYPRNGSFLMADPVFTVQHEDPRTLAETLTLIGVNASSNIVMYFRAFSGNVAAATGISFTVANGRAMPDTINTSQGQIATGGMRVIATSANDTHPWAVNTGATLP
jgi:hypothetical protein